MLDFSKKSKYATFILLLLIQIILFEARLLWAAKLEPPGAARLVSPSGTTLTNQQTYNWKAVPNTTKYYLWVDDSTGNKIQKWYTAKTAGCPNGTGTCSVTPPVSLAPGAGTWRIQTWNKADYGPWSLQWLFRYQSCRQYGSPIPLLEEVTQLMEFFSV